MTKKVGTPNTPKKYHVFYFLAYEGHWYGGAFDTQEAAEEKAGPDGYVFYGIKLQGEDE